MIYVYGQTFKKISRSKYFLPILAISICLVGLTTLSANAAKPETNKCATIQDGTIQYGRPTTAVAGIIPIGYDQWGYNYQAHIFNGYYDNSARPTDAVTSGDWLVMKWNDAWLSNKDCVEQYNSDGDEGVKGQDNKLDRHIGYKTYRGSGAWLTNHVNGTYESNNWNVIGTYKWLVLGTYEHDLVITQQNSDGTFSGVGGYPAGNAPYTSAGQTSETITGKVDGNTITFTTTYNGPYNPGYAVTVTGNISADGSVSGNSPWEWHTTYGKASKKLCSWSDFIKIVAVPSDAEKVGENWYTKDNTLIGPDIWGQFAIIQEVSSDPCGQSEGLMNFRSDLKNGLGHWED